jgi:replicative DNA helicase
MFFNEDAKNIYEFALDIKQKHGKYPSESFTKSNFPNFTRVKITDPIELLIEAFKKWRQAQVVKARLEAATERYADLDIEGAIAEIEEGLQQIAAESLTDEGDRDLTADALDRFDAYKDFASRPAGLLGVTTGYPTIDAALSGFRPKQLVTVVALPKVGKSTLAMAMGVAAHGEGKTVMLQTIEMSADEMEQRYDAMRAGVSYTRFAHGTLTPKEEQKYRQMLRDTGKMANKFVVTESVQNVAQIAAKIDEIKPEIVIVDGVYLLQSHPDFAPGSPQALTYLTRAFKKLAQSTDTTIIVTTQALAQKLQGGRVTEHSIGYAAGFLQDSDLVLGLEHNEAKDEDVRILSILAARSAGKTDVTLDWDWDKGNFTEMGTP